MALSRQTHVYERRTDVALELDIYVPDRLSASGGALLWLHGGALIMGSRADVRDDVLRLADHLGVTLVSPDFAADQPGAFTYAGGAVAVNVGAIASSVAVVVR